MKWLFVLSVAGTRASAGLSSRRQIVVQHYHVLTEVCNKQGVRE